MVKPTSDGDDQIIILNYHDAVIKGSDMNLLERSTEWLNDSCIHFYFTWLAQEQKEKKDCQQKSGASAAVTSSNDYFMDPSIVSFFMHQCIDEEEIEELVNSLPFPKAPQSKDDRPGRIFIAVSDNMAVGSDYQTPRIGGNHWTLLVVCLVKADVQFLHFDSMKGSGNSLAAGHIARKIARYVYPNESGSVRSKTTTQAAKTPQQANGYDCGVHVLGAAKMFVNQSATNSLGDYEEALHTSVGGNAMKFCADLRQEIVSEIRRLSSKHNEFIVH
jgi:sentrin-specific protease 8